MAQSLFIDKAVQEAEEATILEGDMRADKLLKQARQAIYHWPDDFKGFSCDLHASQDAETVQGQFSTGGSRRIEIDVPDLLDSRWLRYQLEELIAHREAPSVSKMASKTGCSYGDWDQVYGRRIDFLGDKMSSFYRLLDNKITQIGRSYKSMRFVINIDRHQDCNGEFAAQDYTAYYWDLADNSLKKVETYQDSYICLDGVFLPSERRVTEAANGAFTVRSIRLENLKVKGA